MKVAIMGAGLSGLCCALMLERHGIQPFIFEKRSQVGDRFVNGEIFLSLLYKPVDNIIGHLSEQYQIYLQPTANIRKLVVYSANQRAEIHGNLGFANIRGREAGSTENQLARQLKTNINFNSTHTYEQLVQDYTHVVLATGDAAYATKIQDYRVDLTVTIRGVTVTGDFDRYSACAWLDNSLAPQGYCYFIPFSETEANIALSYPDYPHNQAQDLDELWERAFGRVQQDLQQTLKITDKFEITRYIIGSCRYPRIGNTFFVGNNFGSIMPFLGFGQYAAILTGIYAAMDICGLGKYEHLIRELRRSYDNSLALRRAMEKLDNNKLDLVVQALAGPLGERLFNTKRINPLRALGFLLR